MPVSWEYCTRRRFRLQNEEDHDMSSNMMRMIAAGTFLLATGATAAAQGRVEKSCHHGWRRRPERF
jgi:hypothetical protein